MKKITLLWVLLFSTFITIAQTSLGAGDIAFLGVNTDGVSDADDNFAFVLLKDIEANTTITFTDRGWNDGSGFVEPLANGDGEFTWTASSALGAGSVVVLDFSNLNPAAASFTVLGDQLFALQGTISSPVFIAGMQLNIGTGSDDANWDGAATTNTTSALPDALTTGDTAIRFPIEQDNWQFSCASGGCPLSGTPEQIRAILHNPSNWISDNDNVFPSTVDVNFGTPTVGSLGSITVFKNVDDDTYADMMFEFNIAGTPFSISENTVGGYVVSNLAPGTYNINELVPENWDLVSINAGVQQNNTAAINGVNIVLEEGENVIATFNNVYAPVDNTLPVITSCPESIEMDSNRSTELGNECGDFVTWELPMASDNLPGVILNSNYEPGDLFPFGATEVVYTATDAAGNQAECRFMVSLIDKKAPAPICINGLFVELDAISGLGTILATDFIASPNDDSCGPVTYLISRVGSDVKSPSLTLSCEDEENTLVRIWAKDVNGNSDYCETYILVDKSQYMCPVPPMITCPLDVIIQEGGSTLPSNTGTATATGGVGTVAITWSDVVGPDGTITRSWTATDENGGASSCDQTITVSPACEITIDTQPQSVMLCENEAHTFQVLASGTGDIEYDWQQSTDGGVTWTSNPDYANGGTSRYFGGGFVNISGFQYRVEATSNNGTPNDDTDDCSVISDVAITTINPLPIVSLEYLADLPVNIGVQSNLGGGLPAQGTQVGDHGIYSGPGVIDDGNGLNFSWDPEVAGEGIKTITYTYTNGSGCTSSATDEILVLPTLPLISISDLIQVEGTGGTTSFAFEVSLSEASTQSITMRYTTMDDFAVSSDDYEGVISETLTFSPGETSKNITINVVADSEIEEDETFFVQLSETNFELSWPLKGRAKGTIVNDDRECELMVEITGNKSYCYNGEGVVLDAGAGFASYLWSPGGQTTQTISAVTGNYTVEVSNEFGCKVISEEFTVAKNQELVCNIEQDKLATNHITADGVATVYPTGGTGDFTYLWDNGETTQTATALTYGMHGVTVTDSNGCETHCQIDIAKILYCWTNVNQNVSVLGGSDGAASVQGNGGYRPYTFKWDDGSTDAINSALSVGIHHVTITDATGATSQCSVTISGPSKDKCSDFVSSVEQDRLATNHVTEDGVATVYPKGGSGQYTFLWDNGETTQTAIKLTYGVHTVIVTDSKGCETSCQINIAKVLYCWTNLIYNVSDYGYNDGAAGVQGNGGYRPYTFKWDDGSTNAVNNALSAGIHYVVITDATGATSQCSVTISQPNEEVCDGVDNDGDGKIDEGFDQDGDGIADCFDKCDKGDDHVDADHDGIPDACDDNICIKGEMPEIACYQTAEWNIETCSWEIIGEQPMEPVTECYETAIWNGATCSWDIIDGQPEMPQTECYETAVWSDQICSWEIIGEQPMEPVTECYETAIWNGATCSWDIVDGQPEMPQTECYETAVWSDQICSWEIIGEQPMEPVTECYETAIWNEATCSWDIVDGQPEMPQTECYETAVWSDQICNWEIIGEQPMEPVTECYETAVWSDQICNWEIIGEQPMEPVTECYETAIWNEATCSWDIVDGQPEMPQTECYETAVWSDQICNWEIIGEQPMEPVTECYETAVWSDQICNWEIIGEQPREPVTECYETAVWSDQICNWEIIGEQPMEPVTECNETAIWNAVTCEWDIIENDNDCGNGSITQCETAFARSSDEDARTCFLDIPGLNTNRWGWTNEFPSINGTYEMNLYAAAGQCDITKGALVGNVVVVYENGLVDVTVSVFNGYKMTEAQLYVGADPIPATNNGSLTVAPGKYPYQDDEIGDFTSYTFENVSTGDMNNFYVILHANVCPNGTGKQFTPLKVELTAFPVPFKHNLNLKIVSPYTMDSEFSMYNGIGQKVQDFGSFVLKKGDNELHLDINELPIGMYYLKMSSTYGNQTFKVLRE